MANRIFLIVIAFALSGCTSQPIGRDLATGLVQAFVFPNLDFPDECSGHSDVPTPATRCMTSAEYETARKKARNSRNNGGTAKRSDSGDDPELSEVIPGVPASPPTNPCSEPGRKDCTAVGEQ